VIFVAKFMKTDILMVLIGITLIVSAISLYGTIQINGKVAAIDSLITAPSPSPSPSPSPTPTPTVTATFDSSDPVDGNANAPVTIIEFSDFQCPFCSAVVGVNNSVSQALTQRDPTWQPPIPNIINNYVKTGKAKLVFRQFPLTSLHPYAEKAAEAALCANAQGKFWEYHDELFNHQDALDVASLKQYAANLKLDTAKFNTCLDNGAMASAVAKDESEGQSYGVSGTPDFFINGAQITGAQSFSVFKQAIDQALAK